MLITVMVLYFYLINKVFMLDYYGSFEYSSYKLKDYGYKFAECRESSKKLGKKAIIGKHPV